jgi:flagellar hook protein FlgE
VINPAMASALSGLQGNQHSFQRHAREIGRAGTAPDATLRPRDVVGLKTAQRGYEANLVVLRKSDEMLGSLLDIMA